MKTLPPDLQTHLSSGTTTLCWCWKITRRDGTVLGFTDHDAPLAFAGTAFAAASGFTAGEMKSAADLSVDNLSVMGALRADSLNEHDLAAGLFDNAAIEIWRVNWAAPDQRVLMRSGTLGEVKRGKTAFEAEVRGLTQSLNQPLGRVFSHVCDAVLGDGRCSVAVTPVAGSVVTVSDNRRFTATGAFVATSGWYAGGKLTFTSGTNAGRAIEVKRQTLASGIASFELWQAMSETVVAGDAFTVTPGCDHAFATCKTKFSNAANFRGHPYMIGADAALAAASSSTPLDGGSRYGN
jgi:uncharacterized phage protein (TIGR02218 family)